VKIAFVGLGAIGQEVLQRLATGAVRVTVMGALVADRERARPCATFGSLDALLDSGCDLVVECARQHLLAEVGPRILASGRNMLVCSVGALAGEGTYEALKRAAEIAGTRMFIPAGALAGIDGLAAARHVGIDTVLYMRRASPATWVKSGALEAAVADSLDRPRVIFEGNAREAAQRYPKNANVTATVALAGIGFEATRVVLLADPAATSNVHVIEAKGAFGRLAAEISAAPIPGSTSSAIVAGSLVRAVLSHIDRIVV
jgi:aspartate dehydrogenase